MFTDNIETYWAIANHSIAILGLITEGWIFYRFVKPFMKEKAYLVGVSYSITMLVFYCVPQEVTYPNLQGVFVACLTMCLVERRNRKQKVFLATCMYLFRWVVYGVTLVLRDLMFALFIETPHMLMHPIKQWITYTIVELAYYSIALTVMYLVIQLIHKVYVNKKEDVAGIELVLLFATLLTVMIGYFTFNFVSNVYIEDLEKYIWNVHPEYTWLRVIYQIVSFVAILIAIIIYQKLKEKQQEERENILLAEQIETTKQHIREVEKLYQNIRALKHDMGNHICVLENLFCQFEAGTDDVVFLKKEWKNYLSELKATWNENMSEIKTGNPVTDVILTQKQKEAEEKGIDFRCKYVYPVDTNINAFDVSVILNNAITNAIEGAEGCENPYVSISSYRQKNAYMLEVTNCIIKYVEIDDETGLPETTKKDKGSHGFGLANIRKVAQKYYGDIDIRQDESSFTLTVMLMVE
ncbi:MAG: GHKL domain-containing protein [Lachnospiraceae bacterium]|nr:GHKL domain-containing protein [Lachnospiraceae bacterium]